MIMDTCLHAFIYMYGVMIRMMDIMDNTNIAIIIVAHNIQTLIHN